MGTTLDLAQRLATVVSIQQEILSAVTDLQRVLDAIAARAPECTGGEGASVEILDGDDLVCRAASGPASVLLGGRRPSASTLSGEAIRDRRVLHCDDTAVDDRLDAATARNRGVRSIIAAPLVDGGRAVGALSSYSSRANSFADLDAYTLQLLSGLAASAFLTAHSIEQRRLSEERYRLLFERNVAGVFRSTRDGRLLDCNEALVEYLGYASTDELIAHSTWQLYAERADRDGLLQRLDRERTVTDIRLRFRKKDGTEFTAVMNATLIPGDGGDQLLGTFVQASDG